MAGKLAKHVGITLRTARHGQQITLVALARQSGVAVGTISRIENGQMTGTLASHLKLAQALGMRLGDLYAGIDAEVATTQVRASTLDSQHVRVYKARGSSVAFLADDLLHKNLAPMLITLIRGGSFPCKRGRGRVERFLYVVAGQVEAKVGGVTHQLTHDSVIYTQTPAPLFLRNTGRTTARCLSVETSSIGVGHSH